jgi:hypothetical protein
MVIFLQIFLSSMIDSRFPREAIMLLCNE